MATLRRITETVRMLCDRVFEYSTLDVQTRVLAELLRLACDHRIIDNRTTIASFPTHSDIANRLSTHREAVSRQLKTLENQGLITRKAHNTVIINDVKNFTKVVRIAMAGHSVE